MPVLRLDLTQEMVTGFCEKWHINEFAVFGSVLRSDFGPDSDLDVLGSFSPEADWGLFDHHKWNRSWSLCWIARLTS